jgi:hypothetical protein
VLDEKMKDAVKITVIATGFKEEDMRRLRQQENFDPVIMSRDGSRDSRESSRESSRRFHLADVSKPDPVFEPEPAFHSEPTPVSFRETSQSQGDVISLDGMRTVAPNYQGDDLDVPAFLRKRNDVM